MQVVKAKEISCYIFNAKFTLFACAKFNFVAEKPHRIPFVSRLDFSVLPFCFKELHFKSCCYCSHTLAK